MSNEVSNSQVREMLMECERAILSRPQTPLDITHHFSDGIYYREMLLEAGTVATGAVHLTEHRMISIGDIELWDGKETLRLTGYHTFISKAGTKRMAYAHADTILISLHPTDETDPIQLRKDLVCESFEEYDEWTQTLIEHQKRIT